MKDIKEKNHGFEKSGALQITILRKVGVFHFRENGLAVTFTWPNEPQSTENAEERAGAG